MKLKQIKEGLQGYFLYNGMQIAKKLGTNKFKIYSDDIYFIDFGGEETRLTPQKFLLRNIHSSLLDLEEYEAVGFDLKNVLPSINFNIFNKYDKRNLEIEYHKDLLAKIESNKSNKLLGKKNNALICIESSKGNEYFICDFKNKDLITVDEKLLDTSDIKAAVVFDNKSKVVTALNDDLKNQFENLYKKEVEKWKKI